MLVYQRVPQVRTFHVFIILRPWDPKPFFLQDVDVVAAVKVDKK